MFLNNKQGPKKATYNAIVSSIFWLKYAHVEGGMAGEPRGSCIIHQAHRQGQHSTKKVVSCSSGFRADSYSYSSVT